MKSLFARKPAEPVKRKVNLADPERLAALRRLKLMDTPPEESLDRLTRIAAKVVGAPVALLTLVDSHRQYFKSAYGLPKELEETRQTPLTHSFCQHVVMDQTPMIVGDARLDPRLKDNPAIEAVGVLAYAGMPVFAPNGEPLGSFCVMDTRVRQWDQEQLSTLKDLADSVMAELEAKEMMNALVNQEETRRAIGDEISKDVMSNVRALINDLNGVLQAKSIGPAISDAIDTAQKIGVRLNDLQDVASFSDESITPNFHRVEITMLVQGALKDLQTTSAELQVSITNDIPAGLPRVLASENLITRALKILIRQAMSFSTAGGSVKVWAAKDEDAVAVFISNVSAKSEQAIHDAWMKGEKPNVGLAFCTHTIQDHGGTIGVATMADGSYAMRFTLPTLHEIGA